MLLIKKSTIYVKVKLDNQHKLINRWASIPAVKIKWEEATCIDLDTSPQWQLELSGEKQKYTSSMLALMSIFKRQNMEVNVLMDSYIPIKSIKTNKKRKRYTANLE